MISNRKSAILAGALAFGFLTVKAQPATGTIPTQPPSDLRLDESALKKSEALTHFAMGLFFREDREVMIGEYLTPMLKALKLEPENPTYIDAVIAPLVLRKDFAEIVKVLDPVAAENPKSAILQLILAESAAQNSGPQSAADFLERAVNQNKAPIPGLIRELCIYLWRAEKYEKIEKHLSKALRHKHTKKKFLVLQAAAVYYHNASLLKEEKDASKSAIKRYKRKALRYADKAVKQLQNCTQIRDFNGLLEIFENQELHSRREDLLQKAKDVEALNSPALDLALADLYLEIDQQEKADPILHKLEKEHAENPAVSLSLADAYTRIGDTQRAIRLFENTLKKIKPSDRLLLTLANLYLQVNQAEKALPLLRLCKSETTEHFYLLSHTHYTLEQYEDAAKALMKMEQVAPEGSPIFSVGYYHYYATLCEKLGYLERATEMARKAYNLEPNNPNCNNFLGYILADRNTDLEKAEKLIMNAIEQEPDNIAFLDSQAWVYYRLGRISEALDIILTSYRLSINNCDPVILDHAGDICREAGYSTLAHFFWWEALQQGAQKPVEIRNKITSLSSQANDY